MELQGSVAVRVAAENAGSAGLFDQDPLDLAPPRDDARSLALRAAEAVGPANVPRGAVTVARQLELPDALAVRGGDSGARLVGPDARP
jgi:hypothetical protein